MEYLKIILSPQIIVGLIVIFFAFQFKENIKKLIDRIANIKLPGGGELATPQKEKEFGDLKEPPIPQEVLPVLPGELKLNAEEVKSVKELFNAERAKAYLWEYRYLNYYLAPNTQKVLDWLSSFEQRSTIDYFDTLWMQAIQNADERLAIVNALQKHHLILITDNLIVVTPKGKEYIEWRGKI